MKRLFAIILVIVMLFSLSACGKTETPAPTEAPSQTEPPVQDNAPAENPAEEGTIGDALKAEFLGLVAGGTTDLQEITDGLIANPAIKFSPVTGAVEEGPLSGFNAEISGFEEAVMFAPMIGSIPFVGYVFRTADEDASQALTETLATNANLRWNVCVEADEMVVEQEGDLVLFVMCPRAMED